MRILCFGSLNYDYVYTVDHFHLPQETLAAESFMRSFGGKGLNQSIALAKAGLDVWHAGRVGADGQPLINCLSESCVHTDYILKDDNAVCGHAVIEVCEGQNRILLFGGANKAVDEKQADETLSHFEKGDWLVLQNEISCIPHLIKTAKEKGMGIFFNAAPMGPEVADCPLDSVDILCVNEIEGAALLGKEAAPEETSRLLHEKYPASDILLTAGEGGSFYCGKEGCFHVPAKKVKAVDTTAAGDTYSGYFLAGLSLGMNTKEAMELASKAAAMAVQKAGAAASVPMIDDVLKEEQI